MAGAAALIKAASGAANGVIVSRLARNAEAAGTRDQTGNGRLNLDRAIADTSTASVQPQGAAPVAGGGPFVGPYVAAARNLLLTFAGAGSGSVKVTPNTGTVSAPVSCGGTGTAVASQTVTSTCLPNITTSDNGATVTFLATAASGSVFGGWSLPANLSSSTCTGTTNPCSAVLGGNPALTVTFNANSTPSGANKTITINEDTSYTFAAADFGFTDPNVGDTMSAVRIDTLALAAGSTLRLSGVDVTAGQVIPTASIPNLVFTPAPNASGSPYASFTFSVRDTNGPTFDPSPNTMTINVTAVNDAPVIAFTSGDTTANEGQTKTYTFSVTDPDSVSFTYDASYPTCGTGGTVSGTPTIGSSSGSFDCSFPDGPTSSTVAVRIRDASVASNEITRGVTVANVAPTVALSGDAGSTRATPHLHVHGHRPRQRYVHGDRVVWRQRRPDRHGGADTSSARSRTGPSSTCPCRRPLRRRGRQPGSMTVTVANVAPTVVLSGDA